MSFKEGILTHLNPADFRVNQNFAETVGVKKLLTTVPVRKPSKHDFFRVHPSSDYFMQAAVLELKEQGEMYLVSPEMCSEIPNEVTPKAIFTAITRQGNVFLWPVGMPGIDGKLNPWHAAAIDAAERAKSNWIRMAANMNLGAYDVYEATGKLPDPDWPEKNFEELFTIAFKGLIIDSPEHSAVKQLMGEV